jgi:glycosyltransferase involved in cell wall biosynthesis
MRLSVITPSFNQGPYIERTLQSVLSQDWRPIEYVVFDAGSKDETVSLLTRYGNHIRWRSEPDRGQAHAVNKGIQATTGDIIGWLNSDDVYYPGAVRTVMDYFADHPEVDVVYGLADHIDAHDKWIEDYPTEDWDLEKLKLTCFICQPTVFFRRKVVAEHGLLDENLHYCMDYEYWLRLGAAGVRFARLPVKLAGSRMYRENKTLGARVKVHSEINGMFRKQFDRVPDRWLSNYAHAVVDCNFDRTRHPRRFLVAVALQSVLASLYWNARVSRAMSRTTLSWTLHAFGR